MHSTPSASPDFEASWGDFSVYAEPITHARDLLLECHSNVSGHEEALAIYTDRVTVLHEAGPPPASLPVGEISGWALHTEGTSVFVDVHGQPSLQAVLPSGYSGPIKAAMTRLLGPAASADRAALIH